MNEVKANEPFLPALEAATEVYHLLKEPKNDCPSVDDVLSFNKESTKCSGIENSACEAKYGLRTEGGGMAPYITQGEDELNLGALDGILDEIDEVEDLDFANGLSDIDLAEEVSALGRGPCGGLHFGDSISDSHSPDHSGSSNGAVGTSETSTVTTTPDMKCKDETCRRRGRCACSFDLGKVDELEKDVGCLVPEPSDEDEKGAAEGSRIAVNAREKRQRKPPQRYIEESSKANSRDGHKQASAVGKDKPPLWRQPKKKRTGLVEPELEDDSSASESENIILGKKSTKSVDRRKHQRMWTVGEVTKLVDGICEFGVGHWTDIKRLSFAATAYRTPIDLRDKWRNLLRASYAQKPEKGEAEQKEKSAGRPLPKSLLRRVRELAALHPYPRKTKTRSSFFARNS
ncbi:uncharacterized protein LOC116196340 isoform X1 [Punica granatum]|uniref:Uncharacterized protein LOC116196340 isoform X1 n=2 Tax=Punica granatum TaxID=22663 RepID=A0A6P8CD81_PUNGR|nr:uncharacterized protein LOC116196340 isoform X1 [Punica granatum]